MMNPLTFDPAPIEKGPPWQIPDWAIVPTWILIPAAIFCARLYTLSLSSFGWYHGFNEAVYTEIAVSFLDGSWVPMRGGAPFFDTGPFTSAMMALSYNFLNPWPGSPGAEEQAMRLGVLVAYPIAVWAAYLTGEGLYGKGKGKIAAILVATSPWVILWFGRAQTDAWMVTGILLFLAGLANPAGRRGAALIISGLTVGILSKQPALLALIAVPILYPLPRTKDEAAKMEFRGNGKRVWILTFIGILVGMSWWLAMLFLYPDAIESAKDFHVSARAAPFENWAWTVILGLIIGSGGLLFSAWKGRKPNIALAVLAAGYAVFAVSNSPIGHEYYSLPAVVILAVMAANWKWDKVWLTACVAVSIAFTVPLLAFTGDLDDTQTREMGYAISVGGFYNGTYPVLDQNLSVVSPDRLVPQLHIYSGGREIIPARSVNQTAGVFIVSWEMLDCEQMYETGKTMIHPPLRLFDCRQQVNPVSETAVSL